MEDKKPTGYITIGPKDNFLSCIQVCYTPTPEQIVNLRKYFGWDFITIDEEKKL